MNNPAHSPNPFPPGTAFSSPPGCQPASGAYGGRQNPYPQGFPTSPPTYQPAQTPAPATGGPSHGSSGQPGKSKIPIVVGALTAGIALGLVVLGIIRFASNGRAVAAEEPVTTTTLVPATTPPTTLPTQQPGPIATSPPTTPAPTTTAPAPPTTQPPVTTTPSTNPETAPVPTGTLTETQQRAADDASDQLEWNNWSRAALIDYLAGRYSDLDYSESDATVAVDSLGIDWNEQALKQAESYLRSSAFSKISLHGQLTYEGEAFTDEQATYAVENVQVDWSAQPARYVQEAVDVLPLSRDQLFSMMTYTDIGGFTDEEANAALDGSNIDWNAEAAEAAADRIDRADSEPMTCDELTEQLEDYDRFTAEQAKAGAIAVGVCQGS